MGVLEMANMRNNLKKMVDGAEAAFIMFLWCCLWVFLSPIIAIRWFFALWCSTYHYCKHPELTFMECLRYEMADEGMNGSVEKFDFCYRPSKPFNSDEFYRVKEIIESS